MAVGSCGTRPVRRSTKGDEKALIRCRYGLPSASRGLNEDASAEGITLLHLDNIIPDSIRQLSLAYHYISCAKYAFKKYK